MLFRLFTLHPQIFESFLSQSLIARGQAKNIISVERVNWREEFGLGNYRQVDDRPFGGGTGMVLKPEPIFAALQATQALSDFYQTPNLPTVHSRIIPNNSAFYLKSRQQSLSKVTLSLTPRGFPINQDVVTWLTGFEQINILCGRYEGFDARVSEMVDLELSLGNFVLNGGEVAAMSLIEAVSRLLPGFVTKSESVSHESFSGELNHYSEQAEFVIGKRNLTQKSLEMAQTNHTQLFDDTWWRQNILPQIEHPQYTRPEMWQNWQVPEILLQGNHKQIQAWRKRWY